MSTAYNAAGEIKDILYDTAHILLLGEHKEEELLQFCLFKYFRTVLFTHFSHQRSELVYHSLAGDKNYPTCIFLSF